VKFFPTGGRHLHQKLARSTDASHGIRLRVRQLPLLIIDSRKSGTQGTAVILKYAGRHVLKRNPWVLGWCAELMGRETAPPAVHRARQEVLLDRVFDNAKRIPAYASVARAAPDQDRLAFLRDRFPIIDKASLTGTGPAGSVANANRSSGATW
jgi:hypothetical protein